MIIAIIPARGDSKRIPQKNITPLAGKPLLAYSIEDALQTPDIERVFVSTDDPDIAKTAKHYGAEVVKRPQDISHDTATSESALLHTLDFLKASENLEPELVVFLQATSPLRHRDDIQNAIQTLQTQKADSLFSACKLHGLIWRKENEEMHSLSYDYLHRKREQDSPRDLIENGSIFVFKPWVIRKHNNRLGGKIVSYEMHILDSFQVDDEADIALMEQLIPLRQKDQQKPNLSQIRLLALDFDGVLTDNRVRVDENGKESVFCSREDSLGIEMLKNIGLKVVVISKETNPVVAKRCQKLKIPCIQEKDDKLTALKEIARKHALKPEQIAYVGNDVNDMKCLEWVGCPFAVADAAQELKTLGFFTTTKPGGKGAVREVADWILSCKTITKDANPKKR